MLNQNEERVVKIFDEKTRCIVNLCLEICACVHIRSQLGATAGKMAYLFNYGYYAYTQHLLNMLAETYTQYFEIYVSVSLLSMY